MDKAAHHRPSFALGISAYSARIYNYESIQNENLHGWHLSDGMVLLYTDDLGHYSEDYWPTVDPARLPGTTVVAGRPADAAGQRTTSTADWVGGTALPGTTLGAYGMELRAYGNSLHGLKSWFCLDDVIACVGSGITADAGAVETVVENRKLRDPHATLLVDGKAAPTGAGWSARLDGARWLHAEGTGGYVFPKPATLRALREERTATWREINLKYGTDTPVTRPYLTLWQDHGAAPAGASYFWLQAPAASAGRTRQWAAAPRWSSSPTRRPYMPYAAARTACSPRTSGPRARRRRRSSPRTAPPRCWCGRRAGPSPWPSRIRRSCAPRWSWISPGAA